MSTPHHQASSLSTPEGRIRRGREEEKKPEEEEETFNDYDGTSSLPPVPPSLPGKPPMTQCEAKDSPKMTYLHKKFFL